MKQISRRKKGRRLQNYLRSKIMQTFPILRPEDVRVAKNGENGADIKLSKIARRVIPYQFECKNQEKLNLWSAWSQTEKNSSDYQPLLIVGKNKQRPLAVVDAEHYFELTGWKRKDA